MTMLERAKKLQVVRAWNRYSDTNGNRLSAATTYFAFLSLFPLLTLSAAVTAAVLNRSAVNQLKKVIADNLPGLGDKIGVDDIINNAGSIGVVSGVVLLFTSLGWINALRASLRAMSGLEENTGNAVVQRLVDIAALIGLAVVGGVSFAASSLIGMLSDRFVGLLGLQGSWLGDGGLKVLGYVAGVAAGAVLYGYVLAVLPHVAIPRSILIVFSLVGGAVFVLAQRLGGVYVTKLLNKNQAYGSLALPLALLVWIYLLTRIVMLLSAWARVATLDRQLKHAPVVQAAGGPVSEEAVADAAPERPLTPQEAAVDSGLDPKRRFSRTSTAAAAIGRNTADTVSVAAGAVLGAAAITGLLAVGRAGRRLRRLVRG